MMVQIDIDCKIDVNCQRYALENKKKMRKAIMYYEEKMKKTTVTLLKLENVFENLSDNFEYKTDVSIKK